MFAVYVDRIDTSVNQLGKYGCRSDGNRRMLLFVNIALKLGPDR